MHISFSWRKVDEDRSRMSWIYEQIFKSNNRHLNRKDRHVEIHDDVGIKALNDYEIDAKIDRKTDTDTAKTIKTADFLKKLMLKLDRKYIRRLRNDPHMHL